MANRDEHIANLITFVWKELGVNLLPEGETAFVLTMWALLDDAIEEEVTEAVSWYPVERLRKVSVN